MKKFFDFIAFLAILSSIIFVGFCFHYADNFRGFNGTGSEMFLVAIPVFLIAKQIEEAQARKERKIERLKRHNAVLEKKYLLNIKK